MVHGTSCSALALLNEPVVISADGEPRRSPSARRSSPGWSTTRPVPICARWKMLIDMLKHIEERAGAALALEASSLTLADEELIENLLAWLRRRGIGDDPWRR